jgi:hypothetical protein
MATSIFETIRNNADGANKSFKWYQEQVRKLGNVSQNQLMKETTQANRIILGKMYLFVYKPKLKESLPYYDMFPLVIPFRKLDEGFLGVNLHYLPYMVRFKMLGYLNDLSSDENLDENTRVNLSWRVLESYSRLDPIKACTKHYLNECIHSRFLNIPYPDWVIASQLPVENFIKKNKSFVWRETGKKY